MTDASDTAGLWTLHLLSLPPELRAAAIGDPAAHGFAPRDLFPYIEDDAAAQRWLAIFSDMSIKLANVLISVGYAAADLEGDDELAEAGQVFADAMAATIADDRGGLEGFGRGASLGCIAITSISCALWT